MSFHEFDVQCDHALFLYLSFLRRSHVHPNQPFATIPLTFNFVFFSLRVFYQSTPISYRLSLDEVDMHPFLTRNPGQIPKSIPQSATHGRPEWRISKKGVIYAANNASKSPPCVPNVSKDTGELESHPLELLPGPSSEEESIEPEKANSSSNSLSSEGEARAAFFANERAHQQLYTNAMIEWGAAEYARRQMQKQRRATKSDQFSRAFVDPGEIKENFHFMHLLTKKCEQAYKSLYGHRIGGTVKILDNVDPNVLGKHGKIVAVAEDPKDPEKIVSFKIEIQEKRADGAIAYATARPSDIEMRSKGDEGSPKKKGKRGKGKKKKGGKNSSAAKSCSPSECAIDLKPIYDLNVTVTKSDLDRMTSDPSGVPCVLNDMMRRLNVEEDENEMRKLKEEYVNKLIWLKKEGEKGRSRCGVKAVSTSDRFDALASVLELRKGQKTTRSELRIAYVHLELMVDGILNVVDAVRDRPGTQLEDGTRLKELMFGGRFQPFFVALMAMNSRTSVLEKEFVGLLINPRSGFWWSEEVGGHVFIFAGVSDDKYPVACLASSDSRLAVIRGEKTLSSDDSLSLQADLLGVSVDDADKKTIESAFRKKVFKVHPDRAEANGMSKEAAAAKTSFLSDAKDALLLFTPPGQK